MVLLGASLYSRQLFFGSRSIQASSHLSPVCQRAELSTLWGFIYANTTEAFQTHLSAQRRTSSWTINCLVKLFTKDNWHIHLSSIACRAFLR